MVQSFKQFLNKNTFSVYKLGGKEKEDCLDENVGSGHFSVCDLNDFSLGCFRFYSDYLEIGDLFSDIVNSR